MMKKYRINTERVNFRKYKLSSFARLTSVNTPEEK